MGASSYLRRAPISKIRLCLCAVTIKTSQGRITERGQTRVFRRVAGFRSSSSCALRRLGLRSGWDFSRFSGTKLADGYVRFWHKADKLNGLTNVRFWGQSGH